MNCRRVSRVLWIALVALVACRPSGRIATNAPQRPTLPSLFSGQTQAGISLTALPLRDTFGLGAPVEVVYFVRNSAQRSRFRNDPLFFHFDVIAPDGRPMAVVAGPEPGSLGSVPDLVLPTDGILGRVIDLSCAHAAFPARPPGEGQCAWKYTFAKPGPYRLVVRYGPVAAPAQRPSADGHVQLQSDTVEFVIAP